MFSSSQLRTCWQILCDEEKKESAFKRKTVKTAAWDSVVGFPLCTSCCIFLHFHLLHCLSCRWLWKTDLDFHFSLIYHLNYGILDIKGVNFTLTCVYKSHHSHHSRNLLFILPNPLPSLSGSHHSFHQVWESVLLYFLHLSIFHWWVKLSRISFSFLT